jgi:hypothetical protein
MELGQRGQGAGQMFALAVGALAAAVFFAVRLYRLSRMAGAEAGAAAR